MTNETGHTPTIGKEPGANWTFYGVPAHDEGLDPRAAHDGRLTPQPARDELSDRDPGRSEPLAAAEQDTPRPRSRRAGRRRLQPWPRRMPARTHYSPTRSRANCSGAGPRSRTPSSKTPARPSRMRTP